MHGSGTVWRTMQKPLCMLPTSPRGRGYGHWRLCWLVEESVVIDALRECSGVLSLGGGAITSVATQSALRSSSAKKIFLDISLSVVSPRVGFDKARPLLMVNPRQKWSELMSGRRPIYESLSDLNIDVSDLEVSEIVSRIVENL